MLNWRFCVSDPILLLITSSPIRIDLASVVSSGFLVGLMFTIVQTELWMNRQCIFYRLLEREIHSRLIGPPQVESKSCQSNLLTVSRWPFFHSD